ncbi:brefeldin A-inhibited guanine nucleotide-exchange protein, partial [Musa troglodytarum]
MKLSHVQISNCTEVSFPVGNATGNCMSKAEFTRNNRGLDDGKDLSEDYLSSLYDQIVKSEIKISVDSSAPQSKQTSSINKLLGLDSIFNLVNWKQ